MLNASPNVGKDTFADNLFTLGFNRFAFATRVIKTACEMFNLSPHYFTERSLKDIPLTIYPFMTPRAILNLVGTDMGRKMVDEDIWARHVCNNIMIHYKQGNTKFIITDLRFDNELNRVKTEFANEFKIIPVRIDGPNAQPNDFESERSITITDEYVKIGNGRDYGDVPPISGNYRGTRERKMEVEVKITALN